MAESTIARPDPPIYTVAAFSQVHGIARSFFYVLCRQGRGPRLTKVGRRTFVTAEAAAEWRARMEKETPVPATRRNAAEATQPTMAQTS